MEFDLHTELAAESGSGRHDSGSDVITSSPSDLDERLTGKLANAKCGDPPEAIPPL